MTRHALKFGVAFAALVAFALLRFARDLGPQTPVDLRPLPAPAARYPAEGGAPLPAQILATRGVLDELFARFLPLRLEAWNAASDGQALWVFWRSRFGARGGRDGWQWFGTLPRDPVEGPREDRLEAELLRLNAACVELMPQVQDLVDRLARAEGLWQAARRYALSGDRLGAAAAVVELRAELSGAAERLNELGRDTRALQADLDRFHPRLEELLRRRSPREDPPLPPWHWQRARSGELPPAARYDYPARWAAQMAAAQRLLR